MPEMTEEGKRLVIEMLRELHAGKTPDKVKEKFKQVFEGIGSLEIAKIEQELIAEGISREEVQRLCELHLDIFKDRLKKEFGRISETPIKILMEEHKALQQIIEELKTKVDRVRRAVGLNDVSEEVEEIGRIATDLLDAEKHYLREENALFPALERHGITEPPAIMWMEHIKLREIKKKLRNIVASSGTMNFQEFKKLLAETASSLYNTLSSHIFKENNILFPTALQVVTEQEWRDVRNDFDEIEYCCFTPEHLIENRESKG